MSLRSTCGAWVVDQRVRPPEAGSGMASAARGSMGTPHSRWLTMRCFTTCVRLGEGGVGLARLDGRLVLDVLRRIVEELGSAGLHRRELISHRGQGLPRDHHVGRSVHGRRLGGGDHRRYRLADIAHVADRQRIVPPADDSWPLRRPPPRSAHRRNGLAVRAQILARHHLEHARPLHGRRGVDRAHPGVGVRAAHERDVVQSRMLMSPT